MTLENILKKTKKFIGTSALALALTTNITCKSDEEQFEVLIKEGTTNSDGEAYFTDDQTGEEVIIRVLDYETQNPVSGADVTFIDSDGFEGFNVLKEDYVANFQLFPHNSTHIIDVVHRLYNSDALPGTPETFTIWDTMYDDINSEKMVGWQNYFSWMVGGSEQYPGYDHAGCMTKEQMAQAEHYTQIIISTGMTFGVDGGAISVAAGALWAKIETVRNSVIKLEEWGLVDEHLKDEAYDVYQPRNFNSPDKFIGHDLLSYEIPDDKLDNNCNSLIDETDDNNNNDGGDNSNYCSDTLLCDEFNGSGLSSIWRLGGDDNVNVEDGYLVLREYSFVESDPVNVSNNFTLETVMRNTEYGLIIVGDSSNNYELILSDESVGCRDSNNSHDNRGNSINLDSGELEIKLVLEDGTSKVYVDGSKIFEDSNCSQTSGRIQVYLSNTTNNTGNSDYTSFDKIRIK